MEVHTISNSFEQAGYSLVVTDRQGNYYLIPTESFERGRVPEERRAEIERAMQEHEVIGYNPLLIGAAVGAVVTAGAFTAGPVVGGGQVAVGVAVASSGCFERKTLPSL
jgi:hypothetical protein